MRLSCNISSLKESNPLPPENHLEGTIIVTYLGFNFFACFTNKWYNIIGQYKKENNLPVFDAKRESAIKQKFTTKKYQDSLSNIYDTILKESKTIQYDKEHNN